MKTFSVTFDITLVDGIDESQVQKWVAQAVIDNIVSEVGENAGNFEVREVA